MNFLSGMILARGDSRIYLDAVLLFVFLSLLLMGYIMVTSASLHLGEKIAQDSFFYPKRQLIHIAMGLVAAAIVVNLPIVFWEKTGPWLFLGGLMSLVIVLIPGVGVSVNGSRRWLSLAGIRIQASEPFKLLTIMYLASYIVRRAEIVRGSLIAMLIRYRWGLLGKALMSPCGLLMLACFLLLREPDFGAAAVVVMITMGMLFVAGARLGVFALFLALMASAAGLLVYFAPYRMKRILGFINPWDDPLDSGFQLTQALIAFGRGEWLGVGLGGSIQKLFYLPEAHTDFLFSVIGEELGLAGTATVILLFALLVWRAFAIARSAELAGRQFSAYLAYGLCIWFGLQGFINMGVNMAILPTKGLTLPFMSYGGGSMIVMCSAVALLFRIHSEVQETFGNAPRGKAHWVRG